MSRPLSLQTRSLLAASLALAAFLGLTGFALDAAISRSLSTALHQRLQSYVYSYLAGSDLSRGGKLIPPEVPPEPRFGQPNSGLYASVINSKNRWLSDSVPQLSSSAEQSFLTQQLDPGKMEFVGPLKTELGELYVFSLGVSWNIADRANANLTFHVAEDAAQFRAELNVFRRTLFVYLGGAVFVLLIFQILLLRWSLAPLRQIATELDRVELGEQEKLVHAYPQELALLANDINHFIGSERERLSRYRNTLSDLAHSLKTPLAVIQSQLEALPNERRNYSVLFEQVERMNQIVAYQLGRAATSGYQVFSAPIVVAPHAEAIVQGLEKIFVAKHILCEFEIEEKARFFGDKGDLFELLGNLLENAFKWANNRILLTIKEMHSPGSRRPGLEISVEDDGPGISPDQVERLLKRGVRGDERVQGHGIGMAIVQDIVKAYHGELQVARSENLGGALFHLHFAAS